MKNPVIQFRTSRSLTHETLPRFSAVADRMRSQFEARFDDPIQASPGRFCWDFWTLGDQYRLLRTPAASFFEGKIFDEFLAELLDWGRKNLGCQMVSHPWLSAYVDGCQQRLHTDVPHGPFAFVLPLTPRKRRLFRGGETLLAKPTLYRSFHENRSGDSHEDGDLLDRISPEFNRLIVFDPRIPHGVERVEGVPSILESRLVLHGWFTEPRPMLEGALGFKKIMKPMDTFAHSLLDALAEGPYSGLLSLRLSIREDGSVDRIEVLTGSLLDSLGIPIPRRELSRLIRAAPAYFPTAKGNTLLTLPLEIRGKG